MNQFGHSAMDLAYISAAELAGLIRSRAVSPVEVVRTALDRIERGQAVYNAFITIAADAAMEQARAAEAEVMRGAALGPLHGVPVAVKDLIPTANIRTTWGSLIFKDHVPEQDAVAVARLKQAGAIVVGKTTTPEFGQQCLTEAPLFGRTRNAWRADRSSGGSSGGSAVAVAAGLVPIAVATDGGGSTRIPAACNGVVGFKQGLGVVPQEYAQDGFGMIVKQKVSAPVDDMQGGLGQPAGQVARHRQRRAGVVGAMPEIDGRRDVFDGEFPRCGGEPQLGDETIEAGA